MPAAPRFVFDAFELDPDRRRLTSAGEPVAISDRQLDVLLLLVARAGQIISKDDLLTAGWREVAVGDNSLEQVISSLRRILGAHPAGTPGAGPTSGPYIETVARRGYRFSVAVTRTAPRESDDVLDALLAPHRAFIEGRAALESLERDQVARARDVFQGALNSVPDHASAHIGLATACVMQFEMTRADAEPDTAALTMAAHHAREACRLEPESGEAWATLGWSLDRAGRRLDALAASKRAVTLEPDNWRHHLRLSSVSWGEERLRAAHRTLALLPGFPFAHWLAATVHVARQTLNEAQRELTVALAAQTGQADGHSRFNAVALHWLLGLIHLERGDDTRALDEFELELSFEHAGHLYARECCANTWYAIGVLRLRQGRPSDAGAAFEQATERVARHPMAQVGLVAAGSPDGASIHGLPPSGDERPDAFPPSVEAAMFRAAQFAVAGAHTDGARIVNDALSAAAPGSAGWILPIEPLLQVNAHADVWARALAQLRNRAA